MQGSAAAKIERPLSRRELMSSLVGLGLTVAAREAVAEPSSVVHPTPGHTLVYDDFSAGVWPSPLWMKFRTAEYDLWDPETKVHSPGALQSTLTIDPPRFTTSHPNHVKALMLSTTAFDIEQGRSFGVRVEMAVRTFGTERNPF